MTDAVVSVVIFDGACNLCNGLVNFLLDHDDEGRLRFAALQSTAGQELLARHGLAGVDSVVVIEGDRAHTKSAAAIRIADRLGWPYRAARVARLLPTGVRDWLYDRVADNRYDWFGTRDQCRVPDDSVSDRFLS